MKLYYPQDTGLWATHSRADSITPCACGYITYAWNRILQITNEFLWYCGKREGMENAFHSIDAVWKIKLKTTKKEPSVPKREYIGSSVNVGEQHRVKSMGVVESCGV